jgi:hypothetical protein
VGFVADKVTLKRVFPEFFDFSLSISFHRLSPYSYIIWGMSNMSVRAAVQRRSLTPSKSTQAVDSFLGYLTRSCYSCYVVWNSKITVSDELELSWQWPGDNKKCKNASHNDSLPLGRRMNPDLRVRSRRANQATATYRTAQLKWRR